MKFWLPLAALYIGLAFFIHHKAVQVTPLIHDWIVANEVVGR